MIPFPMAVPDGCRHRSALFDSGPLAPRRARALARSALASWGLAHLLDDVELVISELVTNASRLGTPVAVLVSLRPADDEIEIAVWDDGPGLPEPGAPDEEAEAGRGLLLVEARSNAWGWRPGRDGNGKVTWATLGPKPRDDDAAPS